MTKKMGEFEECPVVKEAVPVPLERRRPTGWIAATVVFALVAIGALSFIVIDKELAKKPDSSLKCNESKIDDGKNNNVSDSDMKGFAIRDYFGVLYVTKKGEVYLSPTTETEKDNDWPFLMRVSDYDQNKLPGVRGKYTITEDDIEGFSAGPTDMVQEEKNTDIQEPGLHIRLTQVFQVRRYDEVSHEIFEVMDKDCDGLVNIDAGRFEYEGFSVADEKR